MAIVSFKKGLLADLPSTYAEGTFYITTDERAIYLDVSDSARVRIGDFQEFATLADLQSNTNPSTTALYYIADVNVLAKWNGTGYVQINTDTGATSVEVAGDGNAITAASYDPQTRKITLTKGSTYTTSDDVSGAISLAIGTLGDKEEGTPYANVKDYIDTKVADVVAGSIDGLGALASKDEVAESDLASGLASKINGKADATQVASDIATAKSEVIGTADDTSANDTVKGAKKYADEKAAAVQADVDAVEASIGTVQEGKTVVQMIADAQDAATYDDTALTARVTTAESDIDAVEGKVTTLIGSDSGKSVRTIANEELAAQLIPEGAQESLDTLTEIAQWIQSHPDDASAMNAAIAALQAILDGIGDTESGEKATVVAYVTDAIAALNIGDYAKASDLTALAGRVTTLEGATHTHANKALLDTYTQTEADLADAVAKKHEHTNKTVLDGITSEKVTAWDAAEQNAKGYADGLNTAMDARVDALEAIDHNAYVAADTAVLEDAKEYTDTLMSWGSF